MNDETPENNPAENYPQEFTDEFEQRLARRLDTRAELVDISPAGLTVHTPGPLTGGLQRRVLVAAAAVIAIMVGTSVWDTRSGGPAHITVDPSEPTTQSSADSSSVQRAGANLAWLERLEAASSNTVVRTPMGPVNSFRIRGVEAALVLVEVSGPPTLETVVDPFSDREGAPAPAPGRMVTVPVTTLRSWTNPAWMRHPAEVSSLRINIGPALSSAPGIDVAAGAPPVGTRVLVTLGGVAQGEVADSVNGNDIAIEESDGAAAMLGDAGGRFEDLIASADALTAAGRHQRWLDGLVETAPAVGAAPANPAQEADDASVGPRAVVTVELLGTIGVSELPFDDESSDGPDVLVHFPVKIVDVETPFGTDDVSAAFELIAIPLASHGRSVDVHTVNIPLVGTRMKVLWTPERMNSGGEPPSILLLDGLSGLVIEESDGLAAMVGGGHGLRFDDLTA